MKLIHILSIILTWNVSFAFEAVVVGVTDGDTITVLSSDNEQTRIRLAGIDAPESGQAFGTRAKEAMSGLVFGREVTIHTQSIDGYGRAIANVYVSGTWANLRMVEMGFAWHYKHFSKSIPLAHAESEARKFRRGLWAQKYPTPPWEFRKEGSEQ